jgi:MoaA/NifB/PqqE/SkfB family radical SAM enzyme
MDTLEEFGGQIVASHVVLKDALATKMPRANCLSRDEILCLASRSALIGLPFVNDLLSFTTPGPDGKYSTGIHDLMRQFAAILDLVGPEQLALGADFFDFDHYSARLGVQLGVVGALDTEAGIRNLRKQLINLGLSAEDVTGIMWSNALQFFDTTLLEGAGHASSRGSGGQQLSTRAGSVWSFQDTGNAEVVAACKSCDMAAPAPPSHAWIALNNYCNLACKHCRRTYGRIPGDTVSRDIPDILYDRITSELLPGLQSLILGGNNTSEITTAKRFPDIVKWLSNSHNRPLRISVQTNGAIMGDEQMERLVVMDTVFNISIEGGTNTTCKRIRGISLDALRTRLTRINRARIQHGSKARIVLSFTAMKSNIDELPSLVEFAERCGVDEVNVMYLLPATEQWNAESPVNAIEHNNDVIESTMRLTEAWHVELVAPPIRDINDQPCMRPWYSMSVNGNGGIHFCCLEGSPEIGNLVRQDVSEAWNSDAARQARLSVNSLRPPLECGSCVLRNLPFVSTRALRKQMA